MRKTVKNFSAKNDNGLVYLIEYSIENNDTNYITLELNLLAGWDYVNPDMSDRQGWVKPSNFVESVQYDSCICYIEEESIKEALEENGYSILNKGTTERIIFSLN